MKKKKKKKQALLVLVHVHVHVHLHLDELFLPSCVVSCVVSCVAVCTSSFFTLKRGEKTRACGEDESKPPRLKSRMCVLLLRGVSRCCC